MEDNLPKSEKMPLTTDDCRFFVKLVEAGGISAAARRLGSSPPAVSRRLSALEARFGACLAIRSSRCFALTHEGQRFNERALLVVAEMDDIMAALSDKQSILRGRLRIAAPMEVGRRRLAPLLSRFQALHPQLEIELILSDAGQDLVRDELDFAFRTTTPEDTSLVCQTLLKSRRVVCATPDYLARHGQPETPEDLTHHNCLRLVRGRLIFDEWRFQRNGMPVEIQVRGSLSSTSGEVVHDWALAGLGLALKAEWDITEDLAKGRLVECLARFSVAELCLYGVFLPRPRQTQRLRGLLEYLRAHFAQEGSKAPLHHDAFNNLSPV